MASFTPSIVLHIQSLILLLFLFNLLFVAHSNYHLDPQDHAAISIIKKELGIKSQRFSSPNPCNTPDISCEKRRRGFNANANNSYVLKITRIVLNSQDLSGILSPAIGRLSELKELSLANNKLVHQIPYQISNCKRLEILDLQNNQFSSRVPLEISSLIHLKVLDLSSNKFSGHLNFLKYMSSLEKLSLSDNLFSGKVPTAIKSFRKLKFLNFSGNSLLQLSEFGEIQEYLSKLPKRYVLAENSTNPNQVSSAPAQAPSPSKGSNSSNNGTFSQDQSPPEEEKGKKKKKKNVGAWILGFVAGVVAGVLSGLVFSVVFKLLMVLIKGSKEKDSGLSIFSPFIKKAEDLAFLQKEDDGFSSLEIIGRGGCGEVYKAELSDGKLIAIKKVIQLPTEAAELSEEDSKLLSKKMRQIKSEIQTVGQIRHRNLLPLLAHVPRPDCHYLVYEYMKNGSLQDILQQVTEGKRELNWLTRHRIAVGIASGLEYLHMNHTPRIIHRDLKPANVLLDDDMEARISDFGLAKAMPDAHTHVTTSKVAGTIGYIAPEYHQTLKFTDKCDIYSFGVLLGVLVIGKLPSDDFFQHTSEMSLVKWMRNVMSSEDPKRTIDPSLLMGDDKVYEEQMLLVLKIACFCTLDMPQAKERPNSKEIRLMLSQIKH